MLSWSKNRSASHSYWLVYGFEWFELISPHGRATRSSAASVRLPFLTGHTVTFIDQQLELRSGAGWTGTRRRPQHHRGSANQSAARGRLTHTAPALLRSTAAPQTSPASPHDPLGLRLRVDGGWFCQYNLQTSAQWQAHPLIFGLEAGPGGGWTRARWWGRARMRYWWMTLLQMKGEIRRLARGGCFVFLVWIS